MVRRHQHPLAGKEQFSDLGPFRPEGGRIEAGPVCRDQERRLGRVADGGPSPIRRPRFGAVGQRADPECREQAGLTGQRHRHPGVMEGRRVRRQRELPVREAQGRERHDPGREGAGLVTADDRGRAERFHGGEPPDQGMLPGHPAHAQRERDGGDCRQPLGDGGDRQRDRRLQREEQGRSLDRGGAQRERGGEDGGERQGPPQPLQPALERGLFVSHPGGHFTDPADFRPHAGGDHHRLAPTRRDGRGAVDHGPPLGERGVVRQRRGRVLLHRGRFTGECGLHGLQLRGGAEPGVSRDGLAGLNGDQVARNQLLRRQVEELSLPLHPCPVHLEGQQPFHGAAGAPFRGEADGGIQGQHGEDGPGVTCVAGGEGNSRRPDQEQDQDALELAQQDGDEGSGAERHEPIEARLPAPRRDLGLRQPRRADAQPVLRLVRRQGVPARRGRRGGDGAGRHPEMIPPRPTVDRGGSGSRGCLSP